MDTIKESPDLAGEVDDFDRAIMQQEDEMRDPVKAMEYVRRVLALEQEIAIEDKLPGIPNIVRLIEVLDVKVTVGAESSWRMRARATRMHKRVEVEDIIEVWESHYHGTAYEPPDYEAGAVWEDLDENNESIDWYCFYAHGHGAIAGTRENKIKYLYKALRKQGVKCRIVDGTLQVNRVKLYDAYEALGRYLANLDAYHPIWKENVRE